MSWRPSCAILLFQNEILIRYASRLAKNVAHRSARVCGLYLSHFMKKTALLIDGGWFSKGLGKILNLPNGWPSAAQVVKNARAVLQADEEPFRIFSITTANRLAVKSPIPWTARR